MIVCIAEKPSVAREIATILGARNKRDGYIEGNGYQVTWVFGHLCTLKEPHEYQEKWKRWSIADLPLIPQRFGIKLIENDGSIKQFHIIENLIKNADEVINWGCRTRRRTHSTMGDAEGRMQMSCQTSVDIFINRGVHSRGISKLTTSIRFQQAIRSRSHACHR